MALMTSRRRRSVMRTAGLSDGKTGTCAHDPLLVHHLRPPALRRLDTPRAGEGTGVSYWLYGVIRIPATVPTWMLWVLDAVRERA